MSKTLCGFAGMPELGFIILCASSSAVVAIIMYKPKKDIGKDLVLNKSTNSGKDNVL